MQTLIREIQPVPCLESLAGRLENRPGVVLLRTGLQTDPGARFSFLAAFPRLTFRSLGSHCHFSSPTGTQDCYGNPWQILNHGWQRFELPDEADFPFPLGGCFGFWGYDLRHFVEPSLSRRAANDLELPDCHVGFYDSLVIVDHQLDKAWIVSTGLQADGSRSRAHAQARLERWLELIEAGSHSTIPTHFPGDVRTRALVSTCSRENFLAATRAAQRYIRAGHIYQVNLSHRLAARATLRSWDLFRRLLEVSPAPYAAYLDCGSFQVSSSSPELFLRLSGAQVRTRPIKGTRPRSSDPTRDAQLMYELQTSPKETAELLMITDLLRNDLGRICEFGSVQVPDLARLERFPHVQHLVSTVEGRLRPELTHFEALSSCFPGGSITGAPKIRAMEIIDELEPVTRGPYTGCLGYLGFNRESQLSIVIRTAIGCNGRFYFGAGSGIVADSDPEAEYDETLAKARGFMDALDCPALREIPLARTL